MHWHDLGRNLAAYGTSGVRSPNLDRLAAEGILFTDAHAAAPLCSPSRGAIFSGRYPHDNGLVGLAHHGWEYRDDVQTLPALLGEAGWYTALFGMQHESAYPSRLGYHEFDVRNSFCDHVVGRAQNWLRRFPPTPFLLTAGFFETHRPYPAQRYPRSDPDGFDVPTYLPDVPAVREDLAEFHGSIEVADAAVGELLDTLETEGFADNTWVVFLTDHGEAFPRAKSTLYARGTGIALIVRPPRRLDIAPRVYDSLFSGVDVLPTLLDLLGVPIPDRVQGVSHAAQLMRSGCRRGARGGVRGEDLPRQLRPDPRGPDQGLQLHRELRPPPGARPATRHPGQPVGGRRSCTTCRRIAHRGSCTTCTSTRMSVTTSPSVQSTRKYAITSPRSCTSGARRRAIPCRQRPRAPHRPSVPPRATSPDSTAAPTSAPPTARTVVTWMRCRTRECVAQPS